MATRVASPPSDRTLLTVRSIERKLLLEFPLELILSVWAYARPVLAKTEVERVFHCTSRDPQDMDLFKRPDGSGLLYLSELPGGWGVGEITDTGRCDGQELRITGDVDLGRVPSACLDPRDGSIVCLSQQGRVYKCSGWAAATPAAPAKWQPVRDGRRISNFMHDILCTNDGSLWGLAKPRTSTLPGLYAISRTSLDSRPRRGSLTSQEESLVHCIAYSPPLNSVFALRPRLVEGKSVAEELVRVESVGVSEIDCTPLYSFEPLWNPWFDVGYRLAFITGRSESMIPLLFVFDLHAQTIVSRLTLPSSCPPITRIYTADPLRIWGVSVRAREVRKIRLLSN
ncbi:hypothetical protein FOZ61_005873 [Perkinsus olseni]|uniref:Uncharacterized protein n=1 Tax=Perkinsus olseni TaxID=32597 RepID=A0A7J6LFW1_PEROL|nr:hypothetical protein FOZ61_005873 [Perkinsus olseni]